VSEPLVAALTLLLVAMLYLFMWQVVRSIRCHLAPHPAAQPVVTLSFTVPDGPKRTVVIDRALVVGRSREADLVIDDPFCSDLHARLGVDGGRLTVHDLGSTNGSFVNEIRLTAPCTLGPDDTLRLGRTIMEAR